MSRVPKASVALGKESPVVVKSPTNCGSVEARTVPWAVARPPSHALTTNAIVCGSDGRNDLCGAGQLTPQEQQAILSKQWPVPDYLVDMVWDPELAKTAAYQTDRCCAKLLTNADFTGDPVTNAELNSNWMASTDVAPCHSTRRPRRADPHLPRYRLPAPVPLPCPRPCPPAQSEQDPSALPDLVWSDLGTYDYATGRCDGGTCNGIHNLANSLATRVGCAVTRTCAIEPPNSAPGTVWRTLVACIYHRAPTEPLFQPYKEQPVSCEVCGPTGNGDCCSPALCNGDGDRTGNTEQKACTACGGLVETEKVAPWAVMSPHHASGVGFCTAVFASLSRCPDFKDPESCDQNP
eukprot:gene2258-493_t